MEMEKIEFGYSLKNIGLPSQREYLSQLTHSCEKFVRNLRWRAYFFLKPSSKPEKETYGFRSIKAAPKIKELEKLEDSLYDLVRKWTCYPSYGVFFYQHPMSTCFVTLTHLLQIFKMFGVRLPANSTDLELCPLVVLKVEIK